MARKKQEERAICKKGSNQKNKNNNEIPKEEAGLKLQWIKFIDRYVANGGNGTRAYLDVYSDITDENVAAAGAARLLRNVKVREEIRSKLDAQSVTEAAIVSELWRIAKERKEKSVYAAVKALEILAKIRGMLTDTKKIEFTAENPAVFLPVLSKEEKERFDAMVKSGQRIFE